MEVTPEMRAAVHAADCDAYGHMPDFGDVWSVSDVPNPNDPRGLPLQVLRARDTSRLPHIWCQRCGAVWLVIDTPGRDYQDAVTQAAARAAALTEPADALPAPLPVPGTDGTPIPLAADVDWGQLPDDHPAKRHLRQVEQNDALHPHEPDPAAAQPEPGTVQVITTGPHPPEESLDG